MLLLLDKGVIRISSKGFWNFAQGKQLTTAEKNAVDLIHITQPDTLFVSSKTFNLFARYVPLDIQDQVRARLTVLNPQKYHRRWARRLRSFGVSREDAYELALASFGSIQQGGNLGADVFVTFDLRLVERFEANLPTIQQRFKRMTSQLRVPYRDAMLPILATPQEVASVIG
jgi:hypothetical protein